VNFLIWQKNIWMSDENINYHVPVLLETSLQGLNLKKGGIYVDATFGGGGHSKAILEREEVGQLIAFDQDKEAEQEAKKINKRSFTFWRANFRYMDKYLKMEGVKKVDGILADLGVSSYQIDTAIRGFSTRFNEKLDMRMDTNSQLSAEHIVNTYSESELHKIFGMYGEVKNARQLANTIVRTRISTPIITTEDLLSLARPYVRKGKPSKYFAQIFQALRIEVNDEMNALKDFINNSVGFLKTGGRLVVISYHSLEDRIVKNMIIKGNIEGTEEVDLYGNRNRPLKAINKKPIVADEFEIEQNKRARSAKLRIAERI